MKTIRSALLGLLLTACSDAMTSVSPPPPPPPPANVSVAYCSGREPMRVAFQDGDGTWTRALPATVNGTVVFQANIRSSRSGVPTVPPPSGLSFPHVLY